MTHFEKFLFDTLTGQIVEILNDYASAGHDPRTIIERVALMYGVNVPKPAIEDVEWAVQTDPLYTSHAKPSSRLS